MNLPSVIPMRQQTIDDLWAEAETLGNVRVWTHTDWHEHRTGYEVTITGQKRSTKIEVKRRHSVLPCAIADAINEAREMGLGEE